MSAYESKHFLLASDFDQTLSFNDSGYVLTELLGLSGYREKVSGLAGSNLVQQGGELAYLIRHDPEFRGVRRQHLIEVGRHVRLKSEIPALLDLLSEGIEDYRFSFFVISAAPREVVESALAGVLSPDHIFATELDYDPDSGEVEAVRQVRAGYGKVAAIEELELRLGVPPERVIYVGDGSSDVHVMLHVNNRHGFTVGVSDNTQLVRIAKRTVLSDSAFSILVPVLDSLFEWHPRKIRALFESNGLVLDAWEKESAERVTVRDAAQAKKPAAA